MKKLLAGVALATTACMSLAACGGSSADPVAVQAKSSIAKQLVAQATDASDPLKDATASGCVANGVVDKVGVKQLQTYGLIDAKGNATDTKLENTNASKADATTFADTLFNCVGADKVLAGLKASVLGDASSAPASVKACLDTVLTTATVHDILVAELEGKTSTDAQTAMKAFTTKLMACATAK